MEESSCLGNVGNQLFSAAVTQQITAARRHVFQLRDIVYVSAYLVSANHKRGRRVGSPKKCQFLKRYSCSTVSTHKLTKSAVCVCVCLCVCAHAFTL